MFSNKAKEKRKKKSNVTFYILDDAFTVKHSIYSVLSDESVKKNMRANFHAIGEGILYEELRDTLNKNKADLYFLDTELEDGTGWDLVPLIKEAHKDAHIIMLSDGLNPALRPKRQQYESEVFAVIEKPFQPGIVVGALNELISFIESREELNKSKGKPKKASEELSKNTFVPTSKKSHGGFTPGASLGKKSSLSEVKPFFHKSKTEEQSQSLEQTSKESIVSVSIEDINMPNIENKTQHHEEDFSQTSALFVQEDNSSLLFSFDDEDFTLNKDEKENNDELELIKQDSLMSNQNSEMSKDEFLSLDNYSKVSKKETKIVDNDEPLLHFDEKLTEDELKVIENEDKLNIINSNEALFDDFDIKTNDKQITNDDFMFDFDGELGNFLTENEEKQEKNQKEAITLDEIQFSEGPDAETPVFEKNEQNEELNFFEDDFTLNKNEGSQSEKNNFDFDFEMFDDGAVTQPLAQQVNGIDEVAAKEEDDFLFLDSSFDESQPTTEENNTDEVTGQEFIFDLNETTTEPENEEMFFDFDEPSEITSPDTTFLNDDDNFFDEDFNLEKKLSPTAESFDFNFDLSENDDRENNYQEFGDELSLSEEPDFVSFGSSSHLNFEYSNQDHAYSDEANQEFYFSDTSAETALPEDEFSFDIDEQSDEVDDWGDDDEEFFIRPPMKRF